jgi:type II secretory pathway component GspD/PulD (secretin)
MMRTIVLASLAALVLGAGSVPAVAQVAGSYRGTPAGGANFDFQDAPLGSTLDLIAQWAKVDFAIDPADMDHKVTIHLENATLPQVLDATFLPIGLRYEISGQRVTVSRR